MVAKNGSQSESRVARGVGGRLVWTGQAFVVFYRLEYAWFQDVQRAQTNPDEYQAHICQDPDRCVGRLIFAIVMNA